MKDLWSQKAVSFYAFFFKIWGSAEKFIGWSKYTHRMWQKEVYFATYFAHKLLSSGLLCLDSMGKNHRQQIWGHHMSFSANELFSQLNFQPMNFSLDEIFSKTTFQPTLVRFTNLVQHDTKSPVMMRYLFKLCIYRVSFPYYF